MLLSFTDFLAFKQMFLDYKAVSIVLAENGFLQFPEGCLRVLKCKLSNYTTEQHLTATYYCGQFNVD